MGDKFYVIHTGTFEILIQEKPELLRLGDVGSAVNYLAEGNFFGERALMTSDPRAATVRATEDSVCIAFNRETFEEVISGSNALIGEMILICRRITKLEAYLNTLKRFGRLSL